MAHSTPGDAINTGVCANLTFHILSGRSHDAGHVLIDAMEPVVMRFNFFRGQSGWGSDLDDGASNYEITNNVCVGISMKLREGAHRTITNNIWIHGASFHAFTSAPKTITTATFATSRSCLPRRLASRTI